MMASLVYVLAFSLILHVVFCALWNPRINEDIVSKNSSGISEIQPFELITVGQHSYQVNNWPSLNLRIQVNNTQITLEPFRTSISVNGTMQARIIYAINQDGVETTADQIITDQLFPCMTSFAEDRRKLSSDSFFITSQYRNIPGQYEIEVSSFQAMAIGNPEDFYIFYEYETVSYNTSVNPSSLYSATIKDKNFSYNFPLSGSRNFRNIVNQTNCGKNGRYVFHVKSNRTEATTTTTPKTTATTTSSTAIVTSSTTSITSSTIPSTTSTTSSNASTTPSTTRTTPNTTSTTSSTIPSTTSTTSSNASTTPSTTRTTPNTTSTTSSTIPSTTSTTSSNASTTPSTTRTTPNTTSTTSSTIPSTTSTTSSNASTTPSTTRTTPNTTSTTSSTIPSTTSTTSSNASTTPSTTRTTPSIASTTPSITSTTPSTTSTTSSTVSTTPSTVSTAPSTTSTTPNTTSTTPSTVSTAPSIASTTPSIASTTMSITSTTPSTTSTTPSTASTTPSTTSTTPSIASTTMSITSTTPSTTSTTPSTASTTPSTTNTTPSITSTAPSTTSTTPSITSTTPSTTSTTPSTTNTPPSTTNTPPSTTSITTSTTPITTYIISSPTPATTIIVIHGGWSEWIVIAECVKRNQSFLRSFERKCNRPSPLNGENCKGPSTKSVVCKPRNNLPITQSGIAKMKGKLTIKNFTINGTMTSNTELKTILKDAKGETYIKLKNETQKVLFTLYKKSDPSVIAVSVIGLRVGSLVVDYIIVYDVKKKNISVLNPIKTTINLFESGSQFKGETEPTLVETADYNECDDPGSCDVNAHCLKFEGIYSYSCQCKVGFEGNGFSCSTVKEDDKSSSKRFLILIILVVASVMLIAFIAIIFYIRLNKKKKKTRSFNRASRNTIQFEIIRREIDQRTNKELTRLGEEGNL